MIKKSYLLENLLKLSSVIVSMIPEQFSCSDQSILLKYIHAELSIGAFTLLQWNFLDANQES